MNGRRTSRLPGFDYSQDSSYFVTVGVHDHTRMLGTIANGKTILNACGEIVAHSWQWLGIGIRDDQYDGDEPHLWETLLANRRRP